MPDREVNVLPAAIEAAKARGGLVVIVSDQGTAVIWGHDASGQAEQIISQVAHPSVREGLRQAGRDLGLRV